MNFSDLHGRLKSRVLRSIQGGETSERALARRAGMSQSHLHNILKGKRRFSYFSADLIMEALDLTVQNLIRDSDADGIGR